MVKLATKFSWFLWVLFLAVPSYSAEINFTASVNKQSLALDDRLEYKITISGADIATVPSPKLPELAPQFNVVSSSQSSSLSWINGAVSSTKTNTYILVPIQEGDFVIQPAEINYKGKVLKTNPIAVTVKAGSASLKTPAPTSTQTQNSPQFNQNIFVQATTDKTEAYVGEQIIFQLSLYRRIQLWSNIGYELPEIKGFWTEDLQKSEQAYIQKVFNRRFYVFELAKKALFPISEGSFMIEAAKVGFTVNPFDGQRVIQSDPLTLTIRPLPEKDKPSDFSGIVGELALSESIPQTQVTQNMPISFKITVTGQGNLRNLQSLQFDPVAELKIYKSKVEDNLSTANRIEGSKIFEYIIIPRLAGKFKIPQFKVNFFSLKKDAYQTLSTVAKEIQVIESFVLEQTVTPSIEKETISLLSKDIRYLKTNFSLKSRFWSGVFNLFVALLLGANLVFLLFMGYNPQHTTEKISARAFSRAIKRLKLIKTQPAPKQLSIMHNIFLDFLSEKSGRSLQGKTTQQIQQELKDLLPAAIIEQISALLSEWSYSIYAPAAEGPSDLDLVHRGFELLLKEIDSQLKPKTREHPA